MHRSCAGEGRGEAQSGTMMLLLCFYDCLRHHAGVAPSPAVAVGEGWPLLPERSRRAAVGVRCAGRSGTTQWRGEAGTEPPMPVNSQVQQPWTFTYLFKRFPVAVAGDVVAERTFLAVTNGSIQGMLIFSMHRIALTFTLAGAHE